MTKPITIKDCLCRCARFGLIPTAFDDITSYEEQVFWLYKFLKDTVIPAINANATVEQELLAWFDNLDVQEEINNKLDEMAEDGTLADIIAQYIQLQGVLAFNNVEDMTNATNLVNGSFAETYGYHEKGDGGGAKYIIRTIDSDDVVDNMTLLALTNSETLVAELVMTSPLNILALGAKGDNSTDNTTIIQAAIDKCEERSLACYIPEGTYRLSKVTADDTIAIYGDGQSSILKSIDDNAEDSILNLTNNGIGFSSVHDLTIDGNSSNNASSVHCLKLNITDAAYAGDLYTNLYNIRVTNFSGDGVYFDCEVTGALKEMRVRNVTAIGGKGYGFNIHNTSDSIFSECTAAGTQKAGYHITSGGSLKLSNCKAFWCGIGDGTTPEDVNRLPESAFSATSDASPVPGKTYYTRSGNNTENNYYVFTEFTGSSFDDTATYYENSTFYPKRYAGFILNGTEFLVNNCESQDNFGDGFVVGGSESKFVNTSCDNNGLITVDGSPVSYSSQGKTQLYYGIYLSGWQFSAENCCFMNHQNSSIGKSQRGPALIVGGGYIKINGTESNQVVDPIKIQGISDPLIVESRINNKQWIYNMLAGSYITFGSGYELVDSDMNYMRCDNNTLKFQVAIKKSNGNGMLNGLTTIYFATLGARIRPASRQSITAFATDNYGYLVGGYVTGIVETSGAIGARYVDATLDSYKQIVIQGEIQI